MKQLRKALEHGELVFQTLDINPITSNLNYEHKTHTQSRPPLERSSTRGTQKTDALPNRGSNTARTPMQKNGHQES